MNLYPDERIALFIDGANLHATSRSLDFDIDYRRLLKVFSSRARLIRAYYYTALLEEGDYAPLRPLIDWLNYNGYTVITKPAKEFVDSAGRRKIKGNMDIELAIDAMEMSESIDHFAIFSGDGDFRRLVEALQDKGKRVGVYSSITIQPPMVADELRRQADYFIDLNDLRSEISRDPLPAGAAPPRRHPTNDPRPNDPRHAAPSRATPPSNDHVPGVDEFDERREDSD